MDILVLIEPTSTGYSAYAPEVDGCIATGATREEVEREFASALQFHFEGLREDGASVLGDFALTFKAVE